MATGRPRRAEGDAVVATHGRQLPGQQEHSARQWPADDAGDGRSCHEQRDGTRALTRRKPLREVVDDAREESGLGGAQQKPQRVERRGVVHEGHGSRHQTPREHDPRDPHAGADARQHQVARHLEQRVRHEEDTGPKSVHRGGETEVAVHVERCEPDIHPIEIRDDVQQEQEGNQPPPNPRQCGLRRIGGVCHSGRHRSGHEDGARLFGRAARLKQ